MSSADYYVGHPTTYTAPAPAPGTQQAPPQVVAAGGEQIPVSTQTPGPSTAPMLACDLIAGATHSYSYFVGHPVSPEKTLKPAQPAPSPLPAHGHTTKRSSLLPRCFPCFGGSRVAEQ
ncbi:helicase SRCAP-like isoform X1 [Sorghum bicolor]|uniref:helicase SRCAP-like isoform X1 n=1 Tax=Sorghum bicolor TaxID=4558 RepID=UPI000B425A29|nr:helicase SRCAP-like isoform X1 [Sorghum bicolor]|eukprot:XP_021316405.1 helicase SRCAP-like isoform X1 [Sorghum bicolor]